MSEVKQDAPACLSFLSQPFLRGAAWLCAFGCRNHSAVYLHSGLGMAGADWRFADGSRMACFETVQHMEVTEWL